MSGLTAGSGTFEPTFDPLIYNYTLTVPNGTTSVTIVATKASTEAVWGTFDQPGESVVVGGIKKYFPEGATTSTVITKDTTTDTPTLSVTVDLSSNELLYVDVWWSIRYNGTNQQTKIKVIVAEE